ncbi:site-specific DNA recombinase [Desulfohalotomaculum tongense]|uniref:recombinase family protein n=1 Tax=Desulforadius tongensis TaxID=1216062 RepID=UPI0019563C3A|nr:recombinase family protein [Desulforadius tongensis]MBM7855186.1 site-specific DNA recombinase [Desulforadius tongensis]
MKVAVYCRVSTEDQAESKTIENQVEFAKKYCQLHQMEIYKFYLDEGVSGSKPLPERPAGRRMLSDAERKCFQAVYVYRLDRLARTTLDILNTHDKLSKLGIGLKSMTENFDTSTPSGKFFMTTLGGIAEIERSTIAERMRLGKTRAIKEGRWPGGPPPYGYQVVNKRLVINSGEAEVVRLIFRLYTEENMDTVSVADYLTAAGYASPAVTRNKKNAANVWYGSKIWGILTNFTYTGEFVYGKNKSPEEQQKLYCPAIITRQQWEKARRKLKQNQFNARRNAKHNYLLRGLIRCGTCGRNYCGDGSRSKGRYHYYRCTGTSSFRGKLVKKCSSKYVRADILEKIVWEDILKFLNTRRNLLIELQQKLAAETGCASQSCEFDLIEGALRAKKEERLRILALFRKGVIGEDEVERQLSDINREMQLLQHRQRKLRLQRDTKSALQKQNLNLLNMAALLQEKILTADAAAKRELISVLVDSIVVDTIREGGKECPRVTINYCFAE